METIVLITGANRAGVGIGQGLVARYLRNDNNTVVIAACRDASPERTEHLRALPRGPNCRLIVLPLRLDQPDSLGHACRLLQRQHQIWRIDVVVANAGICDHYGPLAAMTDADLQAHLDVNTVGPLRLFRAMRPFLLPPATDRRPLHHPPRFVYVSTELASLAGLEQHRASLTTAYGMSKAAGNYLVRRVHLEHEDLICFSVDPGLVQTDMGNRGAHAKGLEMAPLTVDQSVDGIVQQIDRATRLTTSGRFLRHNGEQLPW
ncbi:putative short chain-type dehydrogenase [Aspergillus japonicus CBS 114.51]|uniref:Putative short chain-type dehydrogenase n=2 Tax=Aspergillus TaxID=5052 RepID=A0A2V5GXS8_ASPV1|nr:putative short chain-type dehydrogenase [Aspergillus japonicus CBS 114.51]PYI13053.1 putative short chain-type dehydrogenase [Aspergillus violaceofuscus CBS 115571]RAH84783.1 putative short chain-type dehydrogenase [Aspergillus japonicus CBS 114.51]